MGFDSTFLILCLYLKALLIATDDTCDKSKCPGPTAYYQDLKCVPVYKTDCDCCPYKYNCDHLNMRSDDKCYANDHEYEIGESLRDEDANPCDIGCTCRKGINVAGFNCAIVDCFQPPAQIGCYRKSSPYDCCPGEQICPENPEDRATCEIDDKIYKDGEYFTPKSEPELSCVCQPGYEGKNIAPFCRKPTFSACRPDFFTADDIKNNCTPVYYSNQSPQISCSVFFRCQNKDDEVIRKNRNSSPPKADDDMVCQFGHLIMRQGDELNQATDYSSVCVKCVCEVGPTPTCQRLPDNECDPTLHSHFNSED